MQAACIGARRGNGFVIDAASLFGIDLDVSATDMCSLSVSESGLPCSEVSMTARS